MEYDNDRYIDDCIENSGLQLRKEESLDGTNFKDDEVQEHNSEEYKVLVEELTINR